MILIVAIAVINIAVATALPAWSTYMKREREKELVFRGLQYAEGIRVFQQRFGRLPIRLEELIEAEPRSIRKLWEDPMTDSGDWGLIYDTPRRRPGPGERREDRPGEGNPPDGNRGGSDGSGRTNDPLDEEDEDRGDAAGAARPIRGVYSRSSEESLRLFFDRDRYDQWHFTVDLVKAPPSPHAGAFELPRLNVQWVGKPFPPGVEPPGVHPLQPGQGRPRESLDPEGRDAAPARELGGGTATD